MPFFPPPILRDKFFLSLDFALFFPWRSLFEKEGIHGAEGPGPRFFLQRLYEVGSILFFV